MEILKGEFLGTISKTFGKNGEVLLKFNPEYYEVLKKLESILIEIDNIPVPFFISSIEFRNNKSAIITFHNYNHTEMMEEYVGCEVYLENKYYTDSDNPILPFNIKGFKINDRQLGEIGFIENILEYPNNTLIQVIRENKEILLPFNKELIIKADKNKKVIIINLPGGLIDLND